MKSITATPDGPSSAEPTRTPVRSGAPKVVAEGVPSVLRPAPRPADGRQPAVLQLVEAHNHHRTVCPLLAPQEGKAA
ncbi:hypothetical protein [Streptomyces yangpuensis]|uniref:hypothetical protein n=1 Tax=Streptomyces yangpuensis TaxID=1648182 RepID=UPI00368A7697